MSTKLILENWTEYDNRKIRDGRDGRFFACTEPWEVDYLKEKIKRHYPNLTNDQILAAIRQCCETIDSPRPRKHFVECVARRLGISVV